MPTRTGGSDVVATTAVSSFVFILTIQHPWYRRGLQIPELERVVDMNSEPEDAADVVLVES